VNRIGTGTLKEQTAFVAAVMNATSARSLQRQRRVLLSVRD